MLRLGRLEAKELCFLNISTSEEDVWKSVCQGRRQGTVPELPKTLGSIDCLAALYP